MASKKKLKARLKREQRISDELFVQVGMLAGQLQTIDTMLHDAEFPGPTIEAWVAQCQQFLNKLAEERGIVKKSSSVDQNDSMTGPSTSGPSLTSLGSTPDGEYDFLTPSDVNRLGSDAARS